MFQDLLIQYRLPSSSEKEIKYLHPPVDGGNLRVASVSLLAQCYMNTTHTVSTWALLLTWNIR